MPAELSLEERPGQKPMTYAMAHILIVDDEEAFTSGITEYLNLQGHTAVAACTLADARRAIGVKMPTVLLLDLMLPDGSGLELLDAFNRERPEKIVIITGHSGVKSLIGGMAGDNVAYMRKPIEPRELLAMLGSAEAVRRGNGTADDSGANFGQLIGASPVMLNLYEQIRQVAVTDSTVFIQGESGTGKELVADAIHRYSQRNGRFVPVNCGGLTRDLISSQLFGHEKGSFTGASKRHAGFFEQAENGTLFLDEITEMPLEMQTHLLRVLETSRIQRVGAETEVPVNARLIAATNQDPGQAVRDDELREDLYFRLRVFPIHLPPLRERQDDVMLLAERFLQQLNAKNGSSKSLAADAEDKLKAHSWPGNVRELKHSLHRAFILSSGNELQLPDRFDDDLPADIEGLRVGRTIADVERDLILTTLEHLGGDKKAAAASLGVSTRTLYNRLKEYDVEE